MVISTMWERIVGVKDMIVVGILIMRSIKWFLKKKKNRKNEVLPSSVEL